MKRIFGRVELVTDSEGAKLLENLGYDEIHLDLDHLRDTHPRYWSAGKILALRRYDVPVTHVDGDVFFLKEEIKSSFDSQYDAIVQMKEVGSHYDKTYRHLIEQMKPALFNWELDTYSFAYNCGVMGFKNVEFMQDFVEEYFRALRSCQKKQGVIDGISTMYEINIVIEQEHARKGIAHYRKANLSRPPTHSRRNRFCPSLGKEQIRSQVAGKSRSSALGARSGYISQNKEIDESTFICDRYVLLGFSLSSRHYNQ